MKRLLVIGSWEFMRHLTTRSFLLSTFVSPLILAGIVLIPYFYLGHPGANQSQIGFIDFDSTSRYEILSQHLLNSNNVDAQVLLVEIEPDTTTRLGREMRYVDSLHAVIDSLSTDYNLIQDRRQYYFQQPPSRSRRDNLSDTYQQLRTTRDALDQTTIEFEAAFQGLDSMRTIAVIRAADSLLVAREIEGYVVLDSTTIYSGTVDFHASQPINFLRIQPLKQALQVMVVEERMHRNGVAVDKVQDLLQPVTIQEILAEGSVKREFKFLVTYLAPIIVVVFLFISMFTASGYLHASIVQEKSEQVVESVLAIARPWQVIFGKIGGLGILGGLQILIWMVLAQLLILAGIIPAADIGFLTLENAGIFLLYFFLGYLFFASMFVGLGALSSWLPSTHYLHHLMRILALFPIALAILVFQSPDSLLVRILSYIPFLSPTFMVLRTPLGQPPLIDYYITCGVMAVAIAIGMLISLRLFRSASLLEERSFSYRAALELIRDG